MKNKQFWSKILALAMVFSMVSANGGILQILTAKAVTSQKLFYSSFEPPTWNAGWMDSGNWQNDGNDYSCDSKQALIKGDTGKSAHTLTRMQSTAGYSNINLSFNYKIEKN
ncbi:MAG TPA: hypothetical protein PK547_01900 [Candidatus Paceibacterota bacterium]|nr:hypothetical protein [Candidatus Paceibacterota bacterium]